MQMSGGRKTRCVLRTGEFSVSGPQEGESSLCGKRPSTCEALACQEEGGMGSVFCSQWEPWWRFELGSGCAQCPGEGSLVGQVQPVPS